MAGNGPPPKDPSKRARRNAQPVGQRIIEVGYVGPQALPDDLLGDDEQWHPATLRWWDRWCGHPLSASWTTVDWSELEACALLHHEFMRRRTFTLASELRLRMAKFGATPEDRARLRITFADADERELAARSRGALPAGQQSARDRRGPLTAGPSRELVTLDASGSVVASDDPPF